MCNGFKKRAGILSVIAILLVVFLAFPTGCSKKKSSQTCYTCVKGEEYITDVCSEALKDEYEADEYECYIQSGGEEEEKLVSP